jgi:hypothetical protein
MDLIASQGGWDVFLFGIPLIALLVFGFFRLDQVFTARKSGSGGARRPPPGVGQHEKSMRSDPDGRSWDEPSVRSSTMAGGEPEESSRK